MRRRDWLLGFGGSSALRGQWVAEVGFRLHSEEVPLVFVEAQVNSEVLRSVVFDTGNLAAPLVLSRSAAKLCAVAVDEAQILPGAFGVGGGAAQIYRSTVERFEFAGMVTPKLAAGVSPSLDRLAERSGVPMDGNLGAEFWRRFALRVNYARKVLTLSRSAAAGFPFAFAAGKALAIVDVELNGRGGFRFALDTGASYSAVSMQVVRDLQLNRGLDAQVAGAGGVEGGFFTKVARLAGGGNAWGNLTLASGQFFEATAARFGVRVDGVLGANAFLRRALVIDYPARRWAVENG